jgi:hypothetical protein
LATLKPWHSTGSPASWTVVTKGAVGSDDSAGDCESGELACYVTGTGITSFSQFVLKNNEPTAVTMAGMGAAQAGDAIVVMWETTSELNNWGFNLYRDTSEAGPGIKINTDLIPSQAPGSQEGYHYSYLDNGWLAPDTTYYYWLEDGQHDRHRDPPRADERALHRQPDRGGAGPVRRNAGAAGPVGRGPDTGGPGRGRGGCAATGTALASWNVRTCQRSSQICLASHERRDRMK